MPDQEPTLRISAAHQPDAYVIRVQGELDLGGCTDLDLALKRAEESRAERIVVDLEELTFIDSSGMGALVEASRRSASNGNRLELTRGTGHPAKTLRMTGLDQALPLTDPSLCPAIRDRAAAPPARRTRWLRKEITEAERGGLSAL